MGVIGQKLTGADKAPIKAAEIQNKAAEAATAEQRRQYDQTRTDQMPWLQTGQGALNLLSRAAGIATPATRGQFDSQSYLLANPDVAQSEYWSQRPEEHWIKFGSNDGRAASGRGGNYVGGTAATSGTPDYSAFTTSPGYQFRLGEGQKAGQNQMAARGGAYSGNALKALAEYNQNMASNEYGNWWNQIAGLAGVGQSSANTLAGVGQNTAAQIGNNLNAGADARASGIITQTAQRNKANADTAQTIGTFASFFFGGR
jgi:hypothetical protein